MGANVSTPRALRSTQISGSVYNLDITFGAANADTSVQRPIDPINPHIRRYQPMAAADTTEVTIPSVGAAQANEGWRNEAGEPLTDSVTPTPDRAGFDDPITFDAGNWNVRLRFLRAGGLGTGDLSCTVTAILYRVNSAGTFQQEIGRVAAAHNFTTAAATFNQNIVTAGTTDFASGDKIQLEVYLSIPASTQLVTENMILRTGESDANSGSRITLPTFTFKGVRTYSTRMDGVASVIKKVKLPYSARMAGVASVIKKVKLPYSARMAGVASMARLLTLFRVFSGRMAGVPAMARLVTARREFSARMVGISSIIKKVKLPYSARMAGISSIVKTVKLPYSARMAGVAAMQKKITKAFSARMAGVAFMNRALTIRRTVEAAMKGVASAFAKLPFSKIPGGGGVTVVKKIFQIFDD